MPIREMRGVEWEIEDHEDGLMIRFRVPGSKFGSVEVALTVDEAEALSDALVQAAAFASPPGEEQG